MQKHLRLPAVHRFFPEIVPDAEPYDFLKQPAHIGRIVNAYVICRFLQTQIFRFHQLYGGAVPRGQPLVHPLVSQRLRQRKTYHDAFKILQLTINKVRVALQHALLFVISVPKAKAAGFQIRRQRVWLPVCAPAPVLQILPPAPLRP